MRQQSLYVTRLSLAVIVIATMLLIFGWVLDFFSLEYWTMRNT